MTLDPTPPSPTPLASQRILPFARRWPMLAGVVVGLILRLAFSGRPGHSYAAMMGSFIYLSPLLVGAVTVYAAELQRRRSWRYYLWAPFVANVLYVLGTMAIMVEGLVCALLIVPLFGALGALGGLVMGAVCRMTNWPRQTIYSLAALPLVLGGLEQFMPLPERLQAVEHVRLVAASPEQVWRQLENARDIQPRDVCYSFM